MSMFDLSGRVAVITGGNGGIGLGMTQALASSGCNVSIWGRNAEKNKAAAATMAAAPGKVAGEGDIVERQRAGGFIVDPITRIVAEITAVDGDIGCSSGSGDSGS